MVGTWIGSGVHACPAAAHLDSRHTACLKRLPPLFGRTAHPGPPCLPRVCPPAAAKEPAAAGSSSAAAAKGDDEACQRTKFVRDNPALLQKFSADLLPLMIQVCAGVHWRTIEQLGPCSGAALYSQSNVRPPAAVFCITHD
jgi:hypothetical protein